LRDAVVITQGMRADELPLAILAAVLGADPMPPEWSSGSVTASSTGEPLDFLSITPQTPGDSIFLIAGSYSRSASLAVPASGAECMLQVALVPAEPGSRILITDVVVAPGSAIDSGPEPLEVPAAAYRVDVTSTCDRWSIRLER
jgi:hypothetical protein